MITTQLFNLTTKTEEVQTIVVDSNARVVNATIATLPLTGVQLWVILDTAKPSGKRKFVLHDTGKAIGDGEIYAASAILGTMALHVFEVPA